MPGVQFDEEQEFTSRKIFGEPVRPKMVSILLKTGALKNEKQAGYILLIFAIIAFLTSLYLLNISFFQTSVPRTQPPPEIHG